MFNMYDDIGIKTQVQDPYKVKKLEASTSLYNRVADEREQQNQEKQETYYKQKMSNKAKDSYKQMANIHIDEEILHAYQLMSSVVVSVNDNDSIYGCWLKMEENDLKQIPVLGMNKKLKGLVTMKNITKAMIEHKSDEFYINNTPVSAIIIHDIMTAEPISDIRRVAKVMVKYHLNSIPIVDIQKDEVVGIISRADILRAVSSHPHFQLWA